MLGGAYTGPGLDGGIKGENWQVINEKYGTNYTPSQGYKLINTEFPQQLGFIVFFVFLALIISVFTNEKVLFYFLVLVLLGMVLKNADRLSRIIKIPI